MRAGSRTSVSPALIASTAHEQRQLIAGIVSIAFGALIFVFPRFLDYLVAAYFVVVGVGVVLVIAATD
jgi:uncharacterized membrane protein HdeD (DUF308 family)